MRSCRSRVSSAQPLNLAPRSKEGPPMARNTGRHDGPAVFSGDGRGPGPARRDHHGRQWTLGEVAGTAAHSRPSRRESRLCGEPWRARPDLGIGRLTVFGFSTENWRRPKHEVSELMGLLKAYFQSDIDRLEREGVRGQDRRPSIRARPGHLGHRRKGRSPHGAQSPLHPAGRVQLWRARRHRRRRSAS